MSSAQPSTEPASSPSADSSPGRHRGSLLVCALVLAYASLYPFVPLRPPADDALAHFIQLRYITAFDIALNIAAYVPLGVLAVLVLRASGTSRSVIAKATAIGFAFSATMEALQLFIPFRVSQASDVMSNTAGALAGAALFTRPVHERFTRPLGALRERLIEPGPWGDAGLALVALWLIAQLNPALPFFEAGSIGSAGDTHPYEGDIAILALQVIAVALSTCGFGLFVSTLLRGPGGALRTTVALLTIALWLKFVTAATMLKPQLSADWVNEVRVIGLAAGLLIFIALRELERGTRTYLAMLLVLAGALFARIVGDYSPMDDLVRLFRWPHGQLSTFTSLTRYLHEVWPLLVMAYLIASFVSAQRRVVR